MSSAFPLLRLPENVSKLVIQCMENIEIVGFSLVSDKTKEMVRSLHLDMEQIDLMIGDVIEIKFGQNEDNPSTMIWTFYPKEGDTGTKPIPVYMPARVTAMRDLATQHNLVEYKNPGLSIQGWIDHMLYIFSSSEIANLSFSDETCNFDWTSLKDAVGKFKIHTLFFYDLCSLECAQMALRHFSSIKSVIALCSSFNDPSQYSNILIQNLDSLMLLDADVPSKIGLDNLLLMNSKDLCIESSTLTKKIVNQFFKHFIRGSNPRLEVARFVLIDDQVVDNEMILKGLRSQEAQMDLLEEENEEVQEYDIFRKDGTRGRILIEQTD